MTANISRVGKYYFTFLITHETDVKKNEKEKYQQNK
jgi:hypothetical protein